MKWGKEIRRDEMVRRNFSFLWISKNAVRARFMMFCKSCESHSSVIFCTRCSDWIFESYIFDRWKKSNAYLGVVRIQVSGHETLRLFQIFQSIPKRTADAATVPGRRAAIYQLLCAQGEQHAGLLKNLSLYTLRDRVSVATPAVSLVHRRGDKAVFAPIQTLWYTIRVVQNRWYHRFGWQSAPSTRYQFYLEESWRKEEDVVSAIFYLYLAFRNKYISYNIHNKELQF